MAVGMGVAGREEEAMSWQLRLLQPTRKQLPHFRLCVIVWLSVA